ncbi:MAG TPA: efflux RND transporter periplasmic adaptor subunit [Kofleriaceae bacterium]|nr:efflux RND transporter periplasmic adaptor subunit [Kofleriaceae bacterium]
MLGAGTYLYLRADPRPPMESAGPAAAVTVVAAVDDEFHPAREYVATIEPWVHTSVGPQLVSAYVETVLVRPGDIVKRTQVLATLDCRHASARQQQIRANARALDATASAAATEAARLSRLVDDHYVSTNEAEQKNASVASKQADVAAARAELIGSSLRVDDCVLRAPFDGEVASRRLDPGAFARPGTEIVKVVDRHTVRIVSEIPEQDFDAAAPGAAVRIHLHATGTDFDATITRRAPAVNKTTRTAAIEIDVDNRNGSIPVWTTADVSLGIGAPKRATAVPRVAATVHAGKATVFVADRGRAQKLRAAVIGETPNTLYVDSEALAPGTAVVVEGHEILSSGDPIVATNAGWSPASPELR